MRSIHDLISVGTSWLFGWHILVVGHYGKHADQEKTQESWKLERTPSHPLSERKKTKTTERVKGFQDGISSSAVLILTRSAAVSFRPAAALPHKPRLILVLTHRGWVSPQPRSAKMRIAEPEWIAPMNQSGLMTASDGHL
jgi:hypothetical protein